MLVCICMLVICMLVIGLFSGRKNMGYIYIYVYIGSLDHYLEFSLPCIIILITLLLLPTNYLINILILFIMYIVAS
jgi:hypothetical protein